MEMSNSNVKIEKNKLLQKYKTTPYIKEKIKLNQSLKPKQKSILVNSWAIDCPRVIINTE